MCGVNHKGIQCRLLAQENLTYENAYALALSVEVSEKDTVKLQNSRPVPMSPLPTVSTDPSTSEEKVHYSASWKPRKGTTVTCYRCGGAHLATQCKHKDVTCYSCKKKGHFARVCRSKPWLQLPQKSKNTWKVDKSTHYMVDDPASDSESTHELFTISNSFQLDVTLNRVPLRMELDTGASVSILNEDTYKSIQQQSYIAPLVKTLNKLHSYTGHFIQSSPWAAPIVPVLKQNGKMRICRDYKLTINQAAPREVYPLPTVEELFAILSGGKFFSKLDMSNAYLQLPLHDESKQYVTVNTHCGLFQYNHSPFGVSSAPAIFQHYMETLMQGLRDISIYIDDILVTGASLEEHLESLSKVLEHLQAARLRLNRAECFFLRPSITYLGHVIDKDGLHPTQEKVCAIKEVPTPRNVEELRSFLGLVNYYSKFLPNLASKLSPLYVLLSKKQKWEWSTAQEKAFQTAKEALQADSLLIHYNPSKPLVLACDAS